MQQTEPEGDLNLTVSNVVGLKDGKHGFHIHSNSECKDPGPHFNPEGVGRHICIEYFFSRRYLLSHAFELISIRNCMDHIC